MGTDSTSDIRIVLVEPSHPGNIGAVARAMMNMDLRQLVLVRPREFPHPEASARAAGAELVLASARVVDTLEEAIADCGFVAATTSRNRDQNYRVLDVREAADARGCGSPARAGGAAVRSRAHRLDERAPGSQPCAAADSGQPRLRFAESRHGGAAGEL